MISGSQNGINSCYELEGWHLAVYHFNITYYNTFYILSYQDIKHRNYDKLPRNSSNFYSFKSLQGCADLLQKVQFPVGYTLQRSFTLSGYSGLNRANNWKLLFRRFGNIYESLYTDSNSIQSGHLHRSLTHKIRCLLFTCIYYLFTIFLSRHQ